MKARTQPRLKYRLVEPVDIDGTTYYRVQLLKGIERFNAEAGDFGGLVRTHADLSQEGDCWLDFDSVLSNGATLRGNAYLEDSTVSGPVTVTGDSVIIHSELQASPSGESTIADSWLMHTTLRGRCQISKGSFIDTCVIDGDVTIKRGSKIRDCSISGIAKIKKSTLSGCAISGKTKVVFSELNLVKIDNGSTIMGSDISECHIKHCGFFNYAQIEDDSDFMFFNDEFYNVLAVRDNDYHGGAFVSFKRHPLPTRHMSFNEFKDYSESTIEVESSRKMIVEKIDQFVKSK